MLQNAGSLRRAPYLRTMRVAVGALAASCCFASLAAAQDADILKGDWIGSYKCRQGQTAVVVSLLPERGNVVSGSFTFDNMPGRDNAAYGKYFLVGTYDGEGHKLKMRPAGWISQPDGYTAVGFTATLDSAAERLIGSVEFSGCSTIALQKVTDAPASDKDRGVLAKPATR